MRSRRPRLTRSCWAPSCRSRSIRRRVSSDAATIRRREAATSARALALAVAVPTSSVKAVIQVSASIASEPSHRAASSTPHRSPSTTTGQAIEEVTGRPPSRSDMIAGRSVASVRVVLSEAQARPTTSSSALNADAASGPPCRSQVATGTKLPSDSCRQRHAASLGRYVDSSRTTAEKTSSGSRLWATRTANRRSADCWSRSRAWTARLSSSVVASELKERSRVPISATPVPGIRAERSPSSRRPAMRAALVIGRTRVRARKMMNRTISPTDSAKPTTAAMVAVRASPDAASCRAR